MCVCVRVCVCVLGTSELPADSFPVKFCKSLEPEFLFFVTQQAISFL